MGNPETQDMQRPKPQNQIMEKSMTIASVFDRFKKIKTTDFHPGKVENIHFQLNFDDFGAFLLVVDARQRPVEVNYLNTGGATRHILRSLEKIKNTNNFLIDWQKSNDRVYLGDHEYLMWQLRRCENVIDTDQQAILFRERVATVKLVVKAENAKQDRDTKQHFVSSLLLTHEGKEYHDFRLLTESYALAGTEVFEISPLGDDYRDINYFQTEFHERELQRFLSLFFSFIDNVQVAYEDFRTELTDIKVSAEPSLVFEKVDVDECLHMRVCQTIPNLGVDFLNHFELSKLVEFNDLERRIAVKEIDQQPIGDLLLKLEKRIKKHTPKNSSANKDRLVLEGDLFIIPREVASGFIYSELPVLMEHYKIYGADKLKSYKIITAKPSMKMQLDHGIDFLKGRSNLDFNGSSISLFDALKQYNRTKYVLLNDGTHAIVNEGYMRKLERLFKKKKDKVQVSFFDLPVVQELIDDKVAESNFGVSRKIFQGFNQLNKKKAKPPEVKATLRPYQEQGIVWLEYLLKQKLGGCLADDMGLGKTLQTIAILAKVYPKQKKSTLVVMPKTLIFNWENEVKRFTPQLSIYIYYGITREMKDALKANLIFTTYGLVRNDIEMFKRQNFFYVILDESQNIKNIEAQTTKAVMLLKADHRLALSGTPIENNLSELYSLFRFLNPPMFGSIQRFNQYYNIPIQRENDADVIRGITEKDLPVYPQEAEKRRSFGITR